MLSIRCYPSRKRRRGTTVKLFAQGSEAFDPDMNRSQHGVRECLTIMESEDIQVDHKAHMELALQEVAGLR